MALVFSLSNKSNTLPLATRYNVKCVGLSPDGRLAIVVDEGNRPRPERRRWHRVVTDDMGGGRVWASGETRPPPGPAGGLGPHRPPRWARPRLGPWRAGVCGWTRPAPPGSVPRRRGLALQSPAARSGSTQNLAPAGCTSVTACSPLSLPAGGEALLVSLVCRSVLHRFHFKGSVHSVCFSPDGRYGAQAGPRPRVPLPSPAPGLVPQWAWPSRGWGQ